MQLALAFTAYKRIEYMRTVLSSWDNSTGINAIPIVIHVEPVYKAMHQLCSNWRGNTIINPRRYGALENPWHALESGFEQGEFVILAEDDSIVSNDILLYMQWAATEYRQDHSVLAVCAFQRYMLDGPSDAVMRSNEFSPTIWGTWHDRWVGSGGLRDTWDFDYSSGIKPGMQAGWDWNINLRVRKGRKFIVPIYSRAQHIGELDGTHMLAEDFKAAQAPRFELNYRTSKWRELK